MDDALLRGARMRDQELISIYVITLKDREIDYEVSKVFAEHSLTEL